MPTRPIGHGPSPSVQAKPDLGQDLAQIVSSSAQQPSVDRAHREGMVCTGRRINVLVSYLTDYEQKPCFVVLGLPMKSAAYQRHRSCPRLPRRVREVRAFRVAIEINSQLGASGRRRPCYCPNHDLYCPKTPAYLWKSISEYPMTQTQTDFEALALLAGQIFTPSAPVDEKSLFSGRIEQLRKVIDAVNQKGQHAIVYGERGVGKTSMSNVIAAHLQSAQWVLSPRINCDSNDNFKSIFKKIFDEITVIKETRTVGFGGKANRINIPISQLEHLQSPDDVRRALTLLSRGALPILIIDEFDRLNKTAKRSIADLIKTLSDHAVAATIVLVGVADSVDQLFEEHQSTDRAVVQIQMPRMSEAEIKAIVLNGLNRLGMKINTDALERIVLLSQGLPHYTHLLSLYACRATLDEKQLTVTMLSVEKSIDKAITGANQTIRTAWHHAISSPRKDNLFSKVLLACALAETDELGYFAAQDIRAPLAKITGKHYEIPSFAQHLNEFSDDKRGKILLKVGEKRKYRYRFTNPLMQPFVVMHGVSDGVVD